MRSVRFFIAPLLIVMLVPVVALAGAPAADWVLTFDPAVTAGPLSPSLLGQYDLSGALFHEDQVPNLPSLMKAAGFAEWRVGLGRWEFYTLLLPTLTDSTSCAGQLSTAPPQSFAPAGTTDLDLINARDWFSYTDGTPVTIAMTNDDTRYKLSYMRSVLDVVAAFGTLPYVDIDHMPRALAANQTPVRSTADWSEPCSITWTNRVSNVRPADSSVFAAAVAGLVKRVVEGSGGQPGRPVRYWEFWNEPELPYAWSPSVGDFSTYLQTAVRTLIALDAYRKQTVNPDGKAIRIGLGSFASASTVAVVLPVIDAAPFDFVSFHSYSDDPLAIVADIETAAAAVKASATHQNAELALSEWGPNLAGTRLDATTMDLALHHATVIALGAAAGLTHSHHSIFWDYYNSPGPLALIDHQGNPKPAYYAYTLLAQVIGTGASRLMPIGNTDGRLDGGMGALLASRDAEGRVRVLLVNRNAIARTATIGTATVGWTPASVIVLDDPARPPHSVAPSVIITVPPRSIALVEASGPSHRRRAVVTH